MNTRRMVGMAAALSIPVMVPAPVASQSGVIVEGRVVDAGTASPIQNATVELVGYGSTLTSAGGTFRFNGVRRGRHALNVLGFGYAPHTRSLEVQESTTLSVALQIAPFQLDSLLVESRMTELEGRVRDPTRDLNVVDAEILTSQTEPTWTGAHGTFELEGIVAEVPLRVAVRAFGYLPLDTILLPREDTSYLFEVKPDTLVERMIEVQVRRLADRASPRRAVLMRPMDRERLLRFAGRLTIADMLEWEYGRRLSRVRCVLINEEQLVGAWQPSTLFHILPEDVERVEFLFDGAMLRIYTREFIREMISRDVPLRAPSYFDPFPQRGVDPLCR